MVGRCVMGRVVVIQSGRVRMIGLRLTEQIVLLTSRLLLRHTVGLLLLLTLGRLVVAVPERRWETPVGHGESTCHSFRSVLYKVMIQRRCFLCVHREFLQLLLVAIHQALSHQLGLGL